MNRRDVAVEDFRDLVKRNRCHDATEKTKQANLCRCRPPALTLARRRGSSRIAVREFLTTGLVAPRRPEIAT